MRRGCDEAGVAGCAATSGYTAATTEADAGAMAAAS